MSEKEVGAAAHARPRHARGLRHRRSRDEQGDLRGLAARGEGGAHQAGKNAGDLLTGRIRGIDNEAWDRALKDKQVIKPTDDEKAKWQAKFKEVRSALKSQGKVDAGIWTAVISAAGKPTD